MFNFLYLKADFTWEEFLFHFWYLLLLIAGQSFGTFNVTNLSTKSFRKLKITDKLLFGDYTKLPVLHKSHLQKFPQIRDFLKYLFMIVVAAGCITASKPQDWGRGGTQRSWPKHVSPSAFPTGGRSSSPVCHVRSWPF